MIKEYGNTLDALKRLADNGKLLLTGKELVELGIVGSEQTLRNYRWKGEFIRYYKLGSSIKYSISDILKYLNDNLVEPKSKL